MNFNVEVVEMLKCIDVIYGGKQILALWVAGTPDIYVQIRAQLEIGVADIVN